MIAFLTLVLAQPGAAEAADVPACSLITPRGDPVSFFIWADPAPERIRMSALPGSVWPSGTVVATRPSGGGANRFVLGDRKGLILELSPQAQGRTQRSATLFESENARARVPVAYGYCQDKPVAADPPEPSSNRDAVGAGHVAFDSAQWPDGDCGLLLSDGRRIRFDPTLQSRRDELQFTSTNLWSGRPASARVRFSESGGAQIGHFGDQAGPQGVRLMVVDRSRAAELYRFQNLADPAVAGLTGYGICGHRKVVRRPSR